MDIKRLLKVYNYVNDPKKAKVNLKFIGLIAAFLLVGGLLVTFSVLNPPASSPGDSAPQTRTDYVGLTETEAAVYSSDLQRTEEIIEGRLDNWLADHADADVVEVERRYNGGGLWIGYEITYRE